MKPEPTKLNTGQENRWRYNPGAFDVRTVDDRIAYKERIAQGKKAKHSLKRKVEKSGED